VGSANDVEQEFGIPGESSWTPGPPPLQQRVDKLSPAQRLLLQRRAAGLAHHTAPTRHRISTTQFGIWLHEQIQPGGAAYNNCAVLRLRGELDGSALAAALARLQSRHAVLRSRYEEDEEGQVWAVVDGPTINPFQLRTATMSEDARPHEGAGELIAADCADSFDLATGPIWRALLVRCEGGDWLLGVALHHIVSDGTSLGILFAELGAQYLAITAGHAARLPPLRTSFFQLVEHREYGPGRIAADRALQHWKARLAGMPREVNLDWLCGEGPRPAAGGAAVPVRIDRAVMEVFDRLCGRCGASSFSGIAAMFALLLHVGSGQATIPLVTPVDSRGAEGAGVVGCFVNNVVLRLEVEPGMGVDELIRRSGAEMVEALGHHQAPFGRVVAQATGPRVNAQRPLGNVAVVHNNAPDGAATWGPLCVRRQPIAVSAVRFDVALSIARHPDGLRGDVEFAPHLRTRSVHALADDLVWLVKRTGADPRCQVSDVAALLSERR